MSTTIDRAGQQPPDGPGPAGPPSAATRSAGRRPGWELPGLAVLLVGTAGLYLWQLGINGWANSFYAGAVQAGTKNWTAFFFGSVDPGNTITVDKPPAALWVMALSGRLFGFSQWSVLIPQALMGVAAVALLWATVRRISGPGAALLAGAALALTPVAALMFRYNNPDALLVLLMVAAAYCTLRAIEKGGTRWLLLAGLLLGVGFLTKMLQAFLVVPGLALAYLWAAPVSLGTRIRQLLGAAAAIVVGAGWWLLAVALWPVSKRPYIGGSTNNSPLELAFGYNGLGRIFGQGSFGGGGRPGRFPRGEIGSFPGGAASGFPRGGPFPGGGPLPGGRGGGNMFGGDAGLTRLFTGSFGTQIAWMLPAALLLLALGLWLTRRAPRTDLIRAGLLLWGGWMVVTALVFSYMSGIIHQYYTVALAPGVAGVIGIGARELWRVRGSWLGRITFAATTTATAPLAWTMLGWSPEFLPWLRWLVLAVGLGAAVTFLVPRGGRRWLAAAVAGALIAGLLAPAAYAVQTALTPRSGPIVTAGPAVTEGGSSGPGGFPGMGPQRRGGAGGGPGQPFGREGASTNTALITLLKSTDTKWSAATQSSSGAASLELASDTSVIGIGGFMGSDPAPTLEQFQSYVANGQVRYFVVGDMGGGPGGLPGAGNGERAGRGPGGPGGFGRGSGSEISKWVEQHFTASTVGGQTVYDLAHPKT